jgi:hypothetical protein
MRVKIIRALFGAAFFAACAASPAVAQNDCGRPDCRENRPRRVEPPSRPPVTTPKPPPRNPPIRRREPQESGGEATVCEAAQVLVRCGLPGCSVTLDGKMRGLTSDNGELPVEGVPRGTHTIAVSKQGYSGDSRQLTLGCGASETANLSLRIHPVKLRIRTNPPGAEVFVGDPPVQKGKSDAQGIFDYVADTPRLLVTARKGGYFDDNSPVNVNPALAQQEVTLTLKPIPAKLTITANIAGARVRVDKDEARPLNAEPILLAPGPHHVEVDALGYAPAVLDLATSPDEVLKKPLTLERLPVAELVGRAEVGFRANAYEDVLMLCTFALEADASAPAANRLAGMVYVARQDFARAEPYLAKALAGGETVALHVRRHSRESFDMLKGHDACEGFLLLGKDAVEYRGRQVTSENFKVPYAQAQVVGVQLKKDVAAYLATKISDGRGKRQDYNFYSFDRELTAAGRPYLEMIQRLMVPH